ncbi:MAG: pyridoxal-phosphate dependent enzyme [Proteobacteria bacterium]|nr:pyridoxal-phosphate dependent enzyme [Pseudomonadota bacterium]
MRCHSPKLDVLGSHFELWLKMELWQYGNSFKTRAALLAMESLTPEQKMKGVIAMSAGNHAIAVTYAAKKYGVSAKVLMPKAASSVRVDQCKILGAEVLLMENMQELFSKINDIQKAEDRVLVHPFEGERVALGTGTLGLEIHQQLGKLDALMVGIGGGGLIAGVANACKQLQPDIQVIGVEPEGSAVMSASFKEGKPAVLEKNNTIADSLSPPKAEAYSYSLCRKFIDKIVVISDEEIKKAMRFLFYEMKLAVEPAAAVSIAALMGPLREQLSGKRVAIILSGTNIDTRSYCNLINN